MTDRRDTPTNGRVAHVSLYGHVQAERYSEGVWMEVSHPQTDLCRAPNGPRERELLLGAQFLVLEDSHGFAFGYSGHDGYVGYVNAAALREPGTLPSHKVNAIRSYAKEVPELKDTGTKIDLSRGCGVHVSGAHNIWSEIVIDGTVAFVPTQHLSPLRDLQTDPVQVALMYLGTPYLWGGNSAFGIDCSGLVQATLLACGIECPGDADQQQNSLGTEIPDDATLQRGDLLFWKGHVALCLNDREMIHANATDMAVAIENIDDAIARIWAAGDGPVTGRKRL